MLMGARTLRTALRPKPSRAIPKPHPAHCRIPRGHSRDRRHAVRTGANAASTAGPPPPGPAEARSAPPPLTPERAVELQELIAEGFRLTLDSGPAGVRRSIQASRALFDIGQAYVNTVLQGGTPAAPPVILRQLFEKLGATYVKLGQFIASSPSLFPAEYVTEFQKCLDQTDPVPFSDVRATIAGELNEPLDEVFSFIDPKPLASASIAQVHTAELRASGKQVVLKVLKPGVEEVLKTDLTFLCYGVKVLQALNPELERTSIAGIVEDIRTSMLDEVDFVKEAQHIAQFADYLDRSDRRRAATCPFVYPQLSSRRVLTLERLDGVPLTDLNAIKSVTAADPETVLINALNTWMGSVMLADTFHADVHAGNLLVMRDGRVAFLDFGIVGRVSPVTWAAVEALAASVAQRDFVKSARALATMKATNEEVDIHAFAADLEVLFTELNTLSTNVDIVAAPDLSSVSANVNVDETQVNRLLLKLVQVGESHGVRFPREFGLLVKQMLYFDRYVRLLAPELQVLQDSRVSFGDLASGRR